MRIDGDRAIVTLRIAHPGILGRVAARVAGAVEILEPPTARAAVLEWAQRAIAAQEAQETPSTDR